MKGKSIIRWRNPKLMRLLRSASGEEDCKSGSGNLDGCYDGSQAITFCELGSDRVKVKA